MTKNKVTPTQRAKWKAIGYPLHFVGRHKCAFRLATLIENKIVVSTIGAYQPTSNGTLEPLGGATCAEDEMFFETFVFAVDCISNALPGIGKQLDAERCRHDLDAYKLHEEMCVKYQLELNMGMHR
jgi:hypothetical protein